jgi:putative tryptophan/tyrosine transport system substrate-binding protein
MIDRVWLIVALPALLLLLLSCESKQTILPKQNAPVVIGVLDVRLKEGADKFRDRLASRLKLIQPRLISRDVRFLIEHTPYPDGIDAAARRLIEQSPDVLVATNDDAAIALKAATTTIPIVFQSYSDPVAGGIVQSLNASNVNLTGYNFYRRVHLKRWETLLQIAPSTRRIGVLLDPEYVPAGIVDDVNAAKDILGVHVVPLYVKRSEPISMLAGQLLSRQIDALDLPHDGHFTMNQKNTVVEVLKLGVPASFDGDLYCSWGGAVCFARHNASPEVSAADYIELILSGAHASEIPITSPSHYDLSVNATTVKALGLKLPPHILAIARVYE